MRKQKNLSIIIYAFLTLINMVIFMIEIDYGTIKNACREEVSDMLVKVNRVLDTEKNLTDIKLQQIKAKYGLKTDREHIVDTEKMVQDCIDKKAFFNLLH